MDIYARCIEAINQNFQYPPFFSCLIGYYALFATDHWTEVQKSSLKDPALIKDLQRQAEDIILLGWNNRNTDANIGIGQLDIMIKTLDIMNQINSSTGEDITDTSSTICSLLENQWIEGSYKRIKEHFRANQFSSDLIKCTIQMSQGNFTLYANARPSIDQIYKKRFENICDGFGNVEMNMRNFQTLLVFCGLTGESFKNLKQQMAWFMGSENPLAAHDELAMDDLPVLSMYNMLLCSGGFRKRKDDQLRFKEVSKDLVKFVSNEEISHLFFMTILFNSDGTRSLQNQYEYLLVKKLAEFKHLFGASNGDQALCSLRSLFAEYISLSEKFFATHVEEDRKEKMIQEIE